MATWAVDLPSGAHDVGDPGHVADHNTLVDALTEVRTNVDAAESTATWGSVANRPSTFPPTIGTGATQAAAGNHDHSIAADAGSDLAAAANLQAAFVAMATRISELEARVEALEVT